MRSRRHAFTPGFDAVEARVLMATSTTGSTGNESSPVGPPPVGTSSATAIPILDAFAKAYLSHLGQSNYNPAVDTNHNGYVGRRDAYPILRGLAAITPYEPPLLTLAPRTA